MSHFDIGKILQIFIAGGIEVLLFVFLVVLAVLNYKSFKGYYKAGLIIGATLFLMALPSSVLSMVYYSPPGLDEKMKPFLYFGFIIGFGFLVLKIGWLMLVYYVSASEWGRVRPAAFTVFRWSKDAPWKEILASALLGAVFGVASHFIFAALGTRESGWLERYLKNFPGLQDVNIYIRAPIMILAVSAIAISEELVFRGGLLAFLIRITKSVLGPVLIVSLLWAMGHIMNTDMPLAKCTQIFIIGIVFCELARRSCVESAIAAHLGLNVGVVVLWLVGVVK